VTLRWQASAPIDRQINTSLTVVAADGAVVARADGPPARGLIPTNLFFDTPLPDLKQVTLPADLPAGRYRIDVTAYDLETVTPLTPPQPIDWFRVGETPAQAADVADARWSNGLRLVGVDGVPGQFTPGEEVKLRLVWTTDRPPVQDYTVFVHLVGPGGATVAQSDRAPEGGFYPTSGWDVGEQVKDLYSLTLPDELTAGEYQLLVGWYQPESGERLLLEDGSDAFVLTVR